MPPQAQIQFAALSANILLQMFDKLVTSCGLQGCVCACVRVRVCVYAVGAVHACTNCWCCTVAYRLLSNYLADADA